MPALGTADGIGTAEIVRLRAQRVVAALAVGRADRMDRREIQHVEAHRADRRQPRDHIGEGAMPLRIIRGGAGKHLVPACEAGLRTIDIERYRGRVFGGKRPLIRRMHRLQRFPPRAAAQSAATASSDRIRAAMPGTIGRASIMWQPSSISRFTVLAGRVLGGQVVAEGFPGIPPRLNGEAMSADPCRREACLPAIVHDRPHRDTMPVRLVVRAPQHRGRQHVVAIGNDVGADRDAFTHQTLHGKCAIGDAAAGSPRWRSASATSRARIEILIADKPVPHGLCRRCIGENAHLTGSHRRISAFERLLQCERRARLRRQR